MAGGARGRVVLGSFPGGEDRARPARDDALHQVRRRAEGRRTLGCVEDPHPTGRAGTHVQQPTTPRQLPGDGLDGRHDGVHGAARMAAGTLASASFMSSARSATDAWSMAA